MFFKITFLISASHVHPFFSYKIINKKSLNNNYFLKFGNLKDIELNWIDIKSHRSWTKFGVKKMSRERDIYRLKDLFHGNILMKKVKYSVGNFLRNFILKFLVYHILWNLLNWGKNYQKVMPGVNKWVYYMTKAIVLPYLQWYAWSPLYFLVIFSLMYKVCDKLGHHDEIQLGPKLHNLNMVSHPSYV